jgi:hypothetical protein
MTGIPAPPIAAGGNPHEAAYLLPATLALFSVSLQA